MRVVVTGASGLLGRALMARFSEIHPVGYAFSRAEKSGLRKVDLTQEEQVIEALREDRPDIIIHAAAERRPDICTNNQEAALKLNVQATKNIARQAKALGAWVLYISTDYVFDGTKPPYLPSDQTNPINFYGKSKLAGEEALKEILDAYGILRLGMLYGKTEFLGESAVTALIPLLDKPKAKVDDYCKRYPVSTFDVANACWHLAKHAFQTAGFKGIWHCCTSAPLTKYQVLNQIAQLSNRSMECISPVDQPMDNTPRPYDCALDCSSLMALGVEPFLPFSEGIKLALGL